MFNLPEVGLDCPEGTRADANAARFPFDSSGPLGGTPEGTAIGAPAGRTARQNASTSIVISASAPADSVSFNDAVVGRRRFM